MRGSGHRACTAAAANVSLLGMLDPSWQTSAGVHERKCREQCLNVDGTRDTLAALTAHMAIPMVIMRQTPVHKPPSFSRRENLEGLLLPALWRQMP